jgi:1-acyl-sn-glycerol-3-phosphate acyltransferase|tara:strand:- start:18 stop:734 length:717 start_codon:yes stop_codon:yes gene_type:complete
MMLWIRSAIFFVGMTLSAIALCPIALLARPLPPIMRMRVIGLWARFITGWLALTCNLRHEVVGLEHLPGVASVILSKHQSAWETIAFQTIFPAQTWALKKEALWIPFFGWGLAATHPISINRAARHRALGDLLGQGINRLAEGRYVVIFPEGTRLAPGESGVYFPGGAMLAVKAGVPVIPVAHNAGLFWPRRGFIKHPGTIRVSIGPPIITEGKKARAINDHARQWIETEAVRLLEQP